MLISLLLIGCDAAKEVIFYRDININFFKFLLNIFSVRIVALQHLLIINSITDLIMSNTDVK